MAKSKAKKMREKRVRAGKRNPILERSAFAHPEMYNLMHRREQNRKRKNQTTSNIRSGYHPLVSVRIIAASSFIPLPSGFFAREKRSLF